jgi:hypothetical protein
MEKVRSWTSKTVEEKGSGTEGRQRRRVLRRRDDGEGKVMDQWDGGGEG